MSQIILGSTTDMEISLCASCAVLVFWSTCTLNTERIVRGAHDEEKFFLSQFKNHFRYEKSVCVYPA